MKNQEKPPALTIYYDGSCPLCQREIAFYRRNPASHALAWVDVSQPAVLGAGLDCAQAMARFHVRTADGQLFDGAAAFSQLWRRLPGWRLLGWVLAMPPISWLGEGLYRIFCPCASECSAGPAGQGSAPTIAADTRPSPRAHAYF